MFFRKLKKELAELKEENEELKYKNDKISNLLEGTSRILKLEQDAKNRLIAKNRELEQEISQDVIVYVLYFYLADGRPAQLKASQHIEDLERTKKRMEEKNNGKIYKIKPLKELREEQHTAKRLIEDMKSRGLPKDDIATILLVFAKYDDAFKKLADI